jgi:hypothetical protein
MPAQVQHLISWFCDSFALSVSDAYLQAIAAAGFQPGALLSGNTRAGLLQRLSGGCCVCVYVCVCVCVCWRDACTPLYLLAGTATAGSQRCCRAGGVRYSQRRDCLTGGIFVGALSCPCSPCCIAHTTEAAGRNLRAERALTDAFRRFDGCSLPLVDLMGALRQCVPAAPLAAALHALLPCCGLHTVSACLPACLPACLLVLCVAHAAASAASAPLHPLPRRRHTTHTTGQAGCASRRRYVVSRGVAAAGQPSGR